MACAGEEKRSADRQSRNASWKARRHKNALTLRLTASADRITRARREVQRSGGAVTVIDSICRSVWKRTERAMLRGGIFSACAFVCRVETPRAKTPLEVSHDEKTTDPCGPPGHARRNPYCQLTCATPCDSRDGSPQSRASEEDRPRSASCLSWRPHRRPRPSIPAECCHAASTC